MPRLNQTYINQVKSKIQEKIDNCEDWKYWSYKNFAEEPSKRRAFRSYHVILARVATRKKLAESLEEREESMGLSSDKFEALLKDKTLEIKLDEKTEIDSLFKASNFFLELEQIEKLIGGNGEQNDGLRTKGLSDSACYNFMIGKNRRDEENSCKPFHFLCTLLDWDPEEAMEKMSELEQLQTDSETEEKSIIALQSIFEEFDSKELKELIRNLIINYFPERFINSKESFSLCNCIAALNTKLDSRTKNGTNLILLFVAILIRQLSTRETEFHGFQTKLERWVNNNLSFLSSDQSWEDIVEQVMSIERGDCTVNQLSLMIAIKEYEEKPAHLLLEVRQGRNLGYKRISVAQNEKELKHESSEGGVIVDNKQGLVNKLAFIFQTTLNQVLKDRNGDESLIIEILLTTSLLLEMKINNQPVDEYFYLSKRIFSGRRETLISARYPMVFGLYERNLNKLSDGIDYSFSQVEWENKWKLVQEGEGQVEYVDNNSRDYDHLVRSLSQPDKVILVSSSPLTEDSLDAVYETGTPLALWLRTNEITDNMSSLIESENLIIRDFNDFRQLNRQNNLSLIWDHPYRNFNSSTISPF